MTYGFEFSPSGKNQRFLPPPSSEGGVDAASLLGIRRADAGAAQEIVHTDTVEIGEFVQNENGNVEIAQFVIGICGLMNVQKECQLFLRKVAVFAQIADTKLIHNNHPKILWVKGISHIAF